LLEFYFPGKWFRKKISHFAFLAGLARIYVNTQIASQSKGSGYLAQDWSERAGIGSHKGKRFLVGAVDEVYIYTSALTQSQIRELACVCEDSKGNDVFLYTLCT